MPLLRAHSLTQASKQLITLMLCIILAPSLGCGDARLVDTSNQPRGAAPSEDGSDEVEDPEDVKSEMQKAEEWYEEQEIILKRGVYGLLPEMLEGMESSPTQGGAEDGEGPKTTYSFLKGTAFDPFFEQVGPEDKLWSPLGNGEIGSVFTAFVLETAHTDERWVYDTRTASMNEVFFKLDISTEDDPEANLNALEEAIRNSAGHDVLNHTQMQGLAQTRSQQLDVDTDGRACVDIKLNSSPGGSQQFRLQRNGLRLDKFEFGLCVGPRARSLTESTFCLSADPGETQWIKVTLRPTFEVNTCIDARVLWQVELSSPKTRTCKCLHKNVGSKSDSDIVKIATGNQYTNRLTPDSSNPMLYNDRYYKGCLPDDGLLDGYSSPWDIWGNLVNSYESEETEFSRIEMNSILLDWEPVAGDLRNYTEFYEDLHDVEVRGDITQSQFQSKRSTRRAELIDQIREQVDAMMNSCKASMNVFRFLHETDVKIGVGITVEMNMLDVADIPETSANIRTSERDYENDEDRKDPYGDADNKIYLARAHYTTPAPFLLIEPGVYWSYKIGQIQMGAKLEWSQAKNNELSANWSFQGGWLYDKFEWKEVPRQRYESDFSGEFKAPYIEIGGSIDSSIAFGMDLQASLVGFAGPYLDVSGGAKHKAEVNINSGGGGSLTCQTSAQAGLQAKVGFSTGSLAQLFRSFLFDYSTVIFDTCSRHYYLPDYIDDILNDRLCFKWERSCSSFLREEPKALNAIELGIKSINSTSVLPENYPPVTPPGTSDEDAVDENNGGATVDSVYAKRGEELMLIASARVGTRDVTAQIRDADVTQCDYSTWTDKSVFLVKNGKQGNAKRDDKLVVTFPETLQEGDQIYVIRQNRGSGLGQDTDNGGFTCPILHELEVKVGVDGDSGSFTTIGASQDNINGATIAKRHFY